MQLRRLRIAVIVALLCPALASLGGCGKARATVKGKVTFNNRPLTAGTVAFVAPDNRQGSGTIKPDGSYEITDAPVGDVTITVSTPKVPMGPMAAQGMPKPPPGVQGMPKEMMPPGAEANKAVNVVPAPEKYADPKSSPLKYTVQAGSQDHNLELTP